MNSLGIIGGSGMLGADLVQYLSDKFKLTSINRKNYNNYVGKTFDIVINANGNSKRFWANKNPIDDFSASTISVYKTIFDFPCDLYIYISSPDVYPNHAKKETTSESVEINPADLSVYGFHKYLSEVIVKKHKKKYLILRSAMILGEKLRKGPIYDVINGKNIHVLPDTKLQLITTYAISDVIMYLLQHSITNETVNVGGKGVFKFKNIKKYFKKDLKFDKNAQTQIYEMNVGKLNKIYSKLKTSQDYLNDFITM